MHNIIASLLLLFIAANPVSGSNSNSVNAQNDIVNYFNLTGITGNNINIDQIKGVISDLNRINAYKQNTKSEAYNTKSGKVLKTVSGNAIERSSAIVSCDDEPQLCETPQINKITAPTVFPTPTQKPIPTPIPSTPPEPSVTIKLTPIKPIEPINPPIIITPPHPTDPCVPAPCPPYPIIGNPGMQKQIVCLDQPMVCPM